jgi:endonuclease/exonuclease/phosphatase family metal-dependent hydrolase
MTSVQSIQAEKLVSGIPQNSVILGIDMNGEGKSDVYKEVSDKLSKRNPQLRELQDLVRVSSDIPPHRIDFMFVSSNLKPIQFSVKDTAASDHLPLLADIEI